MRTSSTSDTPGTSPSPVPHASWQDYAELKEMLKALGDNARLNIVHALSAGAEVKVTDLALMLAVSQPLVSWHLAILRRHGLVRTRRHGREVYCSLDIERFRRCQRMLAGVVEPPTSRGGSSGSGGAGPPPQATPQAVPQGAPRSSPHSSEAPASGLATEPGARPAKEMAADGHAIRRSSMSDQ